MRRLNQVVIMCCGLAVPGALAQTELYRQNPINLFGGLSSQDARNSGGLGWFSEAADDFQGQAGWTINNVKFWGGYVTTADAPGHTHGFTIRFYSDNNGLPGTRLFEQDVAAFNETLYYTYPPPLSFAGYSYSCDLSPAFSVPSAGTYWVSAVAILDRGGTSNEPQWGWIQSSQAIAGHSDVQWFFSPGNFTYQNQDLGFVISGTAGTSCYANCDHSSAQPILNANDFQCFLNSFAAGESYANCDGSTAQPVLNANDFQCFLNQFATGCS
jgi:hypothetical protein